MLKSFLCNVLVFNICAIKFLKIHIQSKKYEFPFKKVEYNSIIYCFSSFFKKIQYKIFQLLLMKK